MGLFDKLKKQKNKEIVDQNSLEATELNRGEERVTTDGESILDNHAGTVQVKSKPSAVHKEETNSNEAVADEYVTRKIDPKEFIECLDEQGRRVRITKTEWLVNVLPNQLEECWNQPNSLYNLIIYAVQNELPEPVIDAALHLKEIDPIKERGAVVLAIVYLKSEKYDIAESVLQEYINEEGKTGTVLTNLAKIYEARGEHEKSLSTLWEGLELDPNQENGLAWWLGIQREQRGEEAFEEILKEACAIKDSYLPQLYLAREYLKQERKDEAIEIYESVLEKYGTVDQVLFMMSGDMGQAGLIQEMLQYVVPRYIIEKNDVRIGVNLIQGFIATKNVVDGQKLIARLMRLNRPEIRPVLLQMADQLDVIKAESSGPITPPRDQKVEMWALMKPIWAHGVSGSMNFDPPAKRSTADKVGVVVYSNSHRNTPGQSTERETDLGRLTRSIPLFICELFDYYTDNQTVALVPIMRGVGPVVYGQPWKKDAMMQLATDNHCSYMIAGDASVIEDKLHLQTIIYNAKNDIFDEVVEVISPDTMGPQLMKHFEEIFNKVAKKELKKQASPYYSLPNEDVINGYLACLGQSLIQTFVANKINNYEQMFGERNILINYMMFCLHMPEAIQAPLMLANGFMKAKAYNSSVYMEFKDDVLKMLNEYRKNDQITQELMDEMNRVFS